MARKIPEILPFITSKNVVCFECILYTICCLFGFLLIGLGAMSFDDPESRFNVYLMVAGAVFFISGCITFCREVLPIAEPLSGMGVPIFIFMIFPVMLWGSVLLLITPIDYQTWPWILVMVMVVNYWLYLIIYSTCCVLGGYFGFEFIGIFTETHMQHTEERERWKFLVWKA